MTNATFHSIVGCHFTWHMVITQHIKINPLNTPTHRQAHKKRARANNHSAFSRIVFDINFIHYLLNDDEVSNCIRNLFLMRNWRCVRSTTLNFTITNEQQQNENLLMQPKILNELWARSLHFYFIYFVSFSLRSCLVCSHCEIVLNTLDECDAYRK